MLTRGFTVIRDGKKHLSARLGGDEVYRLTKKDDGRWVWCDIYGKKGGGGDNIALVAEIEGEMPFADKVFRLVAASQGQSIAPPAPRTPPKIPFATHGSREAGRRYLVERGIDPEVIAHAERIKMVRFAPGGVFFVGYDQAGVAQAATKRATDPADEVQRRDLAGTDKSYPAILSGDPGRVWIVEGGIDALALHTIYRRKGEPVPTVIVSGGSGIRSFLGRDEVQQILRGAERVTVAYENEDSADKQERTDTQHDAQAEAVRAITGRVPEMWRPRADQGKDLGDLNLYQIKHSERLRQQAELERQRAAEAERQDRDHDAEFGL